MRNSFYYTMLLCCLFFFACQIGKKTAQPNAIPQDFRFAFYNIENFFDTLDNPTRKDEEYMPTSDKEWNTVRWQKKADNLARVIEAMDYPTVLGICEVENAEVLTDFIAKTSLKNYGYDFVHYDSEDMRGIDVALLYRKEFFNPDNKDYIRMDFPDHVEEGYTSRDILHVKGQLNSKPVHFFVNHWPSRYGGTEASEPKRLFVAQHLRDAVDKILEKEKNPNIVIMGDFNDETDNNSVTKVLKAQPIGDSFSPQNLYNCSATLDAEGLGSYNYRGNWNMLDQFIVTGTMLDKKSAIQAHDFQILKEDFMLYYDKKLKMKRPSRTYGGSYYFGGYSDHLPVYIDVTVN